MSNMMVLEEPEVVDNCRKQQAVVGSRLEGLDRQHLCDIAHCVIVVQMLGELLM